MTDKPAGVWKPVHLETGKPRSIVVGPCTLEITRTEDEWLLAAKFDDAHSYRWTKPRPALRRFAAGKEEKIVRLVPATPDRPLIVVPEHPLMVPGGANATYYVGIPLWLKILAGADGEVLLTEEPSEVLSNTWFGEPDAGQLCYTLPTRARRSPDDAEPRPNRAVCAVYVINRAKTPLAIDKFSLRPRPLAVFEGAKQPWTNGVSIVYHGPEKDCAFLYREDAPKEAGASGEIGPPRSALKKNRKKIDLPPAKVFGE